MHNQFIFTQGKVQLPRRIEVKPSQTRYNDDARVGGHITGKSFAFITKGGL